MQFVSYVILYCGYAYGNEDIRWQLTRYFQTLCTSLFLKQLKKHLTEVNTEF